jgi:hypothetical protein
VASNLTGITDFSFNVTVTITLESVMKFRRDMRRRQRGKRQ